MPKEMTKSSSGESVNEFVLLNVHSDCSIENTLRIARRCNTDVLNREKELMQFLPDFEIPDGFENADSFLRHLVKEGLQRRYAKEMKSDAVRWEEIKKRAELELDTIINMGFTGYFLIVADYVNYAKEHDIPVGPGRGTVVGSIVAYSLRITNIDPLKYNLLFERFLNPEHISMPNIDIDFASEGRNDVIKYVAEKYGKDHVGQVVNISHRLDSLHRDSSLTVARIIISKSSLIDQFPIYQEGDISEINNGEGITPQHSTKFLEQCGLVAMNFLSLETLDLIKHTTELIRHRGGSYSSFNVDDVPEDDENTFKMLGEGNSNYVFQFESEGMQNILKEIKTRSIEDLMALNALYRPGPMQNIPRFMDCENGKSPITYPDPSLEGILKETYGVIVYQEQIMEIVKIIAGYSLGRADLLRCTMGKRDEEIIKKERTLFIESAERQGFTAEKAGTIYDILVSLVSGSFNKSHAAAYSVIAYHTAYLKANFPEEFMAACTYQRDKQQDKS